MERSRQALSCQCVGACDSKIFGRLADFPEGPLHQARLVPGRVCIEKGLHQEEFVPEELVPEESKDMSTLTSDRYDFPLFAPSLKARALNFALWYLMRRKQRKNGPEPEVTDALLRKAARATDQRSERNKTVPAFVRIEAVDVDGIASEWVSAGAVSTEKVVLYFHGGGYFMCSPAVHRPITWRLSRAAGRRVLAIDYRQAPDHRFPAWLEDGVKAYRWLLAQGHTAENIVLGGDSAGGNLTLVTLQQIRAEGLPMPAAAFVISPWTDMACMGGSLQDNDSRDPMFSGRGIRALARYLTRGHDARDPLLSPLYADFNGFPPLLVHACSTEVLRDDSRRLVQHVRAAGVSVEYKEWHQLPHVFHIFAGLIPEGRQALDRIGHWIVRQGS